MIGPKPRRGFTLFELVVVISLVAVLVTFLLARLAYYHEMLERAAMESVLRGIKTGLQVRLAELIIANREGEAAASAFGPACSAAPFICLAGPWSGRAALPWLPSGLIAGYELGSALYWAQVLLPFQGDAHDHL